MNGSEIERLLTLIDENIEQNSAARNAEFFRYLGDHRREALEQLRTTGAVVVKTSFGDMSASLEDLRRAAA